MLNFIFSAVQLIDPDEAGLPQPDAGQGALNSIMTEIYIAIGAVALILILIASVRYVMSQGDPAKITQAKNMILYTIIGLVIAASAATIVNYVLQA